MRLSGRFPRIIFSLGIGSFIMDEGKLPNSVMGGFDMNPESVGNQTRLKVLPEEYEAHCRAKGLKESSIQLYVKLSRRFLAGLESAGAETVAEINAERVMQACLSLKSTYYWETIHTFMRFLAEAGYTDRDYSYVIPVHRRPQPMPSVYTPEEIRRIEATIDTSCPNGKRAYAMLLLATRLGLRSGDIIGLTLQELDFEAGLIHLTQHKTDTPMELPLLPEVEMALRDYIEKERGNSEKPYVFLCSIPPYSHLSNSFMRKLVATAVEKAGIDPAGRKVGPRAFRSSLASSMVNDSIPYDVVRKTLGHRDLNAIKNYARLDMEQLRLYALEVPAATGVFAEILTGGTAK